MVIFLAWVGVGLGICLLLVLLEISESLRKMAKRQIEQGEALALIKQKQDLHQEVILARLPAVGKYVSGSDAPKHPINDGGLSLEIPTEKWESPIEGRVFSTTEGKDALLFSDDLYEALAENLENRPKRSGAVFENGESIHKK